MGWPAAEVDVDEGLVRRLLAEQHPDLAGRPLAAAGGGFDNSLWRLGDDLQVRLPRRAAAVPLAANEQRWLPALAPALPLPVPVPVRLGAPCPSYPWPWSVVPWLAGSPAHLAAVTRPEDAARRLATFLLALHRPAPAEAPFNPYRSGPLAEREPSFRRGCEALAGQVDGDRAGQVWASAVAAPAWDEGPVWVHGDLHPDNVLVTGGTLGAVLDFGDLCAGDPATDVAGAWLLLPGPALAVFRDTYGVGDALDRRARGWALLFGLMLAALGLEGRPAYLEVGRRALARVLEADG